MTDENIRHLQTFNWNVKSSLSIDTTIASNTTTTIYSVTTGNTTLLNNSETYPSINAVVGLYPDQIIGIPFPLFLMACCLLLIMLLILIICIVILCKTRSS